MTDDRPDPIDAATPEELRVHKYAVPMVFSREQMAAMTYTYPATPSDRRVFELALGLVEPTLEEAALMAERQAENRHLREERERRAKAARDTLRAALTGIGDPLARAVLDLHDCDEHDVGGENLGLAFCLGCDVDDCEGGPPDWPCRTVRLVAERSGITVPEPLG